MKNIRIQEIKNSYFVLYSHKNYLVIYNVSTSTYIVIEHNNNILYSCDSFYSDEEKNIFEIDMNFIPVHVKDLERIEAKRFKDLEAKWSEENKLRDIKIKSFENLMKNTDNSIFYTTEKLIEEGWVKHVRKLKKHIFKVSGSYLIDMFGDVMQNNGELLTGTLCSVVDCCSTDKFLILADKYKKVRVINSVGKIERFIFVSSEILKVFANKENLYVLTKETIEEYNVLSGELLRKIVLEENATSEDALVYFENEIFLIRRGSLDVSKDAAEYLNYKNKLIKIKIE